jgi:hypothetical protein
MKELGFQRLMDRGRAVPSKRSSPPAESPRYVSAATSQVKHYSDKTPVNCVVLRATSTFASALLAALNDP